MGRIKKGVGSSPTPSLTPTGIAYPSMTFFSFLCSLVAMRLGQNGLRPLSKPTIFDAIESARDWVQPSESGSSGYSPLMIAAENNFYDLAELPIQQGADVNAAHPESTLKLLRDAGAE